MPQRFVLLSVLSLCFLDLYCLDVTCPGMHFLTSLFSLLNLELSGNLRMPFPASRAGHELNERRQGGTAEGLCRHGDGC